MKRLNQGKEVMGSNAAFEKLLGSQEKSTEKKVEDDIFLPVDVRPNGRPLYARTRWLTERIASLDAAFPIQTTKTQVRV